MTALRKTTTVVLSLAAAMTLLGGIGTSCVAFAAENFGPAMAPLIPVKPIFQVLVVLSIATGVVGVVGIVKLIKQRAPNAFWWVLGFLVAGLVTSGIQYWYSLTLRGKTAPNNVRLYLTVLALVWLLIVRTPSLWRRAGFDRTRPDPGDAGAIGGVAMIVTGLLTMTTPLWAAPTHVIDGVNTANVLLTELLVAGGALVLSGIALRRFGRRGLVLRRSSRLSSARGELGYEVHA